MGDPKITPLRSIETILDDEERDRLEREDRSIRAQKWHLDDIERWFRGSRMSDAEKNQHKQMMQTARDELAVRESKLAADRESFAGRGWRRTLEARAALETRRAERSND